MSDKSIKECIGWIVSLTHPDDIDKPKEERRVLIDNEKFRTLKEVTDRINETLKNSEYKISISSIKLISAKKYPGSDSKFYRSLTLTKTKLRYKEVIKKERIYI